MVAACRAETSAPWRPLSGILLSGTRQRAERLSRPKASLAVPWPERRALLGVAAEPEPALTEMDFGRWEGRTLAAVRADDPVLMLTAPIPATQHALKKAGMTIADIDLFECNEAFASVPLAWMKELGIPHEKVNVQGGGIALGHPLGATGARLMTTLLNALERTGGRYGLQTMCEGGGQANVTIIERL